MSAPTKLFDAFRLGPFALSSRVVMAPLTRNRAQPPGMVPGLLAAEYYRQRASAGLIITEASQISRQGQGYQDTRGRAIRTRPAFIRRNRSLAGEE